MDAYAESIRLFEPWAASGNSPELHGQSTDELVSNILQWLKQDNVRLLMAGFRSMGPKWDPESPAGRREWLRSVLVLRQHPLPDHILLAMDTILQREMRDRELIHVADLNDAGGLSVVQADITALRVDAIVNAANSELLGCFAPSHRCIDNCIHSMSGPRLRADCATIMDIQGCEESVGNAKATRAYNLPSRFVIHTVGPNLNEDPSKGAREPTERDRSHLASCYVSCLDVADALPGVNNIAFCCISTGVCCACVAWTASCFVGLMVLAGGLSCR